MKLSRTPWVWAYIRSRTRAAGRTERSREEGVGEAGAFVARRSRFGVLRKGCRRREAVPALVVGQDEQDVGRRSRRALQPAATNRRSCEELLCASTAKVAQGRPARERLNA